MNFVAGALLLACAVRDPTIASTVHTASSCEDKGSHSSDDESANGSIRKEKEESTVLSSTAISSLSSSFAESGSAGVPSIGATIDNDHITSDGPHDNDGDNNGGLQQTDKGEERRQLDQQEPKACKNRIVLVLAGDGGCSDSRDDDNEEEEEEGVHDISDGVVGGGDDGEGYMDDDEAPPKEWRSGPQHTRAEEDVFWLMVALMTRLPGVGAGLVMRELWLPNVPQLKVISEQ